MGLRIGALAFVTALVPTVLAHADGHHELSFDDALAAVLAYNGDVYVAQADATIAGDDLSLAGSVFVPKLVASARVSSDNELGGPARLAFTDRLATGSVELTGLAPTGTTYSLAAGLTDEHLFSPFLSVYDPAYTNSLTLTVTQPLLRGAGRVVNQLPIVVASLRRDLSEQQLRVRLEQIVGDVAVAYWSLELAYKARDARQASVKLAQDQLADSTRLVRLGTISDLDVVEAKSGVGRAQQDLLRAEREIVEAQGKLRSVIVGDPAWKHDDLVPTDDAEIPHEAYSLDDLVRLARANRPDALAAKTEVEVGQAALDVTANGLQPRLDVILSGSLFGFAGSLNNSGIQNDFGSFIPDPKASGGELHALQNFAAGDYVVSLGLRLELPVSNRAAEARYAHERHAAGRARVAHDAILAHVENEVSTSLALLHDDEALEAAADDAVTVDTQLLAGMRKRFASGATTSFDVLRVADELTRAKIEAARARVNYRISLARLATADGTLLTQHHISITSLRKTN